MDSFKKNSIKKLIFTYSKLCVLCLVGLEVFISNYFQFIYRLYCWFKTKPNREVSEEFKTKIKTIFHHLTKEELVEKILANYLSSTNLVNTKPASKNKRQKQ